MTKTSKIEYEISVPVDGVAHTYKTDLVCNSCGKKLADGDYLYFCMKDKDDLCSNYNCLKKHAGHRFFRWGRIEMPSETISPQINTASRTPPPSALKTVFQHTVPFVPAAPPSLIPPTKLTGPPTPSLPAAPPASPNVFPPLSAPAGAPPPSPVPVIRAGIPAFTSLRDEMLKELKSLHAIMKEDEGT